MPNSPTSLFSSIFQAIHSYLLRHTTTVRVTWHVKIEFSGYCYIFCNIVIHDFFHLAWRVQFSMKNTKRATKITPPGGRKSYIFVFNGSIDHCWKFIFGICILNISSNYFLKSVIFCRNLDIHYSKSVIFELISKIFKCEYARIECVGVYVLR